MTKDEALDLALEALESGDGWRQSDAITAIKQARSAPVQEPLVFYRCDGCGHAYEEQHPTSCDCMEGGGFKRVDYYTTPPAAQLQWIGLSDEDVQLLLNQSDLLDMFENIGWYSAPKSGFKKHSATLARAIEAKLREKNNG